MNMKKLVTIYILLFFIIPSFEFNDSTAKSTTTLYVGGKGEGNFSKIQDAIDNASDGYTIFVYSGIYYENVVINKSINLIGEDKNNTIIDGCGKQFTIKFVANNILLRNFTIRNSSNGIYIKANNNSIFNCIIEECKNGILLETSDYNVFKRNIIKNIQEKGIFLKHSYYNEISENFIDSKNADGIYCYATIGNKIHKNLVKNANYSIAYLQSSGYISDNFILNGRCGITVAFSYNVSVTNNTIQNMSGFIIYKGRKSPTGTGIIVAHSKYCYINKNRVISANNSGIVAIYSENIKVDNNKISHVVGNISEEEIKQSIGVGIAFIQTNNNEIVGNNISKINSCGIILGYANNNCIKNNVISYVIGGASQYNLTIPFGYGITSLYSSNNEVIGNIISNTIYGIILEYAKENKIKDNEITHMIGNMNMENLINMPMGCGIAVGFSMGNEIIRNSINNTNFCGILATCSYNNKIKNNSVSHITGNFVEYNASVTIGVGMEIASSINNEIVGNNITNVSFYGIYLLRCKNNRLEDNIISNVEGKISADNIIVIKMGCGIKIFRSYRNKIINNTLKNNGKIGLYLTHCFFNIIKDNKFIKKEKGIYFHAFFRNAFLNIWLNNYWDNWKTRLPKPIFGFVFFLPWINFDLMPDSKVFKLYNIKEIMIIAEFAIFPTSEGVSVSKYVKKAIEEIEKLGLKHETGAMSTTIEAKNLDELFEAVKRAYNAIVEMGARRIHIDLRVDHRLDKDATIESKKRAVQ